MILGRVRLPLQVAEVHCDCRTPLDSRGRHRALCSRSGRLKTRALAAHTGGSVQAGTTVRCNAKLPDTDLAVSAMTGPERCSRQVSLCSSVPNWRDIAMRCALASDGTAQPERPGLTVLCARGLGRPRNGSIPNSSVLTGVPSWWLLLKPEDAEARSPSSSWRQ